MQNSREWIRAVLALVLLGAATGALAGTTGTEFQSLYTWLTGLVQGYFGKAAAVVALTLCLSIGLSKIDKTTERYMAANLPVAEEISGDEADLADETDRGDVNDLFIKSKEIDFLSNPQQ